MANKNLRSLKPKTTPPLSSQVLPCESKVYVQIQTDSYPAETSWVLKSDGQIIDKVDADQGNKRYFSDEICVRSNSRIEFKISDSYGDGLSHGENGYYKIFKDDELLISSDQGAAFGFEESKSYCYLEVKATNEINHVYSDWGTGADDDFSAWRPSSGDGWYSLGDIGESGWGKPSYALLVKDESNTDILTRPTDDNLIWKDSGSGGDMDSSFWEPVPESGYVCLGHVIQPNYNKPSTDLIRCVKEEFVKEGDRNGYRTIVDLEQTGMQVYIDQ